MKKHIIILSSLFVININATVQPVHPGENLWQIVARIGEAIDDLSLTCNGGGGNGAGPCAATPLSGPGPITISESGVYCLTQNIEGESDAITISASHVVLDLNGKKVFNGDNNINVTNQNAVLIKNGFVEGATSNGIRVSNCRRVAIADIQFNENATGVFILNSSSVRVEHCVFTGQTASGTNAGALVIDDSDNVLVRDNIISDNAGNGILLRNGAIKNRIENNVCNQNQTGIYLFDECVKNELIGNTCNENRVENISLSGSGIYLIRNCSENMLSGNTCTGNSATASDENSFADFGGSGIYLNFLCKQNVLEHNTCTGNSATASGVDSLANSGGSGIYLLNSCSENVLEHNTCTGNATTASGENNSADSGGSGIYLSGSSENVISGNTCTGNATTASGENSSADSGGSGIYLFSNCDNNMIAQNTCNDHVEDPNNTGFGIIVGQAFNNTNNVLQANRCLRNTKGVEDRGFDTVSFDNTSVDVGATAIVIS